MTDTFSATKTATQANFFQFEQQLKQLEEAGFGNTQRNIKLLSRTRGEYEIVLNFLKARKALHQTMKKHILDDKISKKQLKLEKCSLKLSRKLVKATNENKSEKMLAKIAKFEAKKAKFEEKIAKFKAMQAAKQESKDEKPKRFRRHFEQKVDAPVATEVAKDVAERPMLDIHPPRRHFRRHFHQQTADTQAEVDSLPVVETWPSEVDHVYLDGNNMLYALRPIRQLMLNGNKEEAALMLEMIARKFGEEMHVKCTLVFDVTRRVFRSDSFAVISAVPSFPSADDLLIKIANELKENASHALIVTSDRKLREALAAAGVQLWKPNQFFRHLANQFNAEKTALDNATMNNWYDKWVQEAGQQDLLMALRLDDMSL